MSLWEEMEKELGVHSDTSDGSESENTKMSSPEAVRAKSHVHKAMYDEIMALETKEDRGDLICNIAETSKMLALLFAIANDDVLDSALEALRKSGTEDEKPYEF